MRIPYHRIAARLFDTPLLARGDEVLRVAKAFTSLQQRAAIGDTTVATDAWGRKMVTAITETGEIRGYDSPYTLIEGAAVIGINAELIHKSETMDTSCGMLGYDGIAARLRMARQDPMVRGIWLDIHSGGGEVSGCFTLADEIRNGSQRAGGKPIVACVNEAAYSAAYALASQCDMIVGPRTAGAGSIGVVIAHADYSGMLEEEGVKVTLIHAGAHKVDGNPYEPLPSAVRADLQAACERTRDIFARTVAATRPMSLDAVLGTEARCYDAPDALRLGLIDEIAAPADALRAFIETLARAG